MRYSEDGWLFQSGEIKNITKDVSEADLFDLVRLAEEEDAWGARVHAEIEARDCLPGGHIRDFLLENIRIQNISGAVVSHPYGDILTFPSTGHFFRGENKEYAQTLPSLNRKISRLSPLEQELYRAVTNMRIEQFCKFLWQIHIVPYWEAYVSDVNYKALAQHYGFETHLLDLTNDFRNALFFATCRYDWDTDAYYPLTEADIKQDEASKYGVIFHTPNWELDYHQPMGTLRLLSQIEMHKMQSPIQIDSGLLDGTAFQIGFQPLMRCRAQSGYVLPMRRDIPLQQDMRFEKLRFHQSPELSQKVFDMMEGGKKVFPYEGITKARYLITAMQRAVIFSEDDLAAAYEYWHVDTTIFPSVGALRSALLAANIEGSPIQIIAEDISYTLPKSVLDEINKAYDSIDICQMLNGKVYMKPEQRARRETRRREIYGKLR